MKKISFTNFSTHLEREGYQVKLEENYAGLTSHAMLHINPAQAAPRLPPPAFGGHRRPHWLGPKARSAQCVARKMIIAVASREMGYKYDRGVRTEEVGLVDFGQVEKQLGNEYWINPKDALQACTRLSIVPPRPRLWSEWEL